MQGWRIVFHDDWRRFFSKGINMRLLFYVFIVVGSVVYHVWTGVEKTQQSEGGAEVGHQTPLANAGVDMRALLSRPPGKTNSRVFKELMDLTAIANISLPLPSASDIEWQLFQDDILAIHNDEQRPGYKLGSITHRSELIGFVAYLAKYKPHLAMQWVDEKVVNVPVFNHLVQMGLLKNWFVLSNNPDYLVKRSQIGLLRLALNQGVEKAESIAMNAFLHTSHEIKSQEQIRKESRQNPVSMVNLRFAMDAMRADQLRRLEELLINKQINIDVNDIAQIASVFPKSTLLTIIDDYATVDASRQAYAFDAVKLGDESVVQQILDDYVQHIGDDSTFRQQAYTHFSRCPICALALNTDGLIVSNAQAKRLQIKPITFSFARNEEGKVLITDWLETEGLTNEN